MAQPHEVLPPAITRSKPNGKLEPSKYFDAKAATMAVLRGRREPNDLLRAVGWIVEQHPTLRDKPEGRVIDLAARFLFCAVEADRNRPPPAAPPPPPAGRRASAALASRVESGRRRLAELDAENEALAATIARHEDQVAIHGSQQARAQLKTARERQAELVSDRNGQRRSVERIETLQRAHAAEIAELDALAAQLDPRSVEREQAPLLERLSVLGAELVKIRDELAAQHKRQSIAAGRASQLASGLGLTELRVVAQDWQRVRINLSRAIDRGCRRAGGVPTQVRADVAIGVYSSLPE